MESDKDIVIREAVESDVGEIRDLFEVAYGADYAFPQFFDTLFLKKQVFSSDSLMLVAEDPTCGRILGTGAVVYDVGAFTDLVGEFGRLVVHPEGRGRGIGKLLMEKRLELVSEHLHIGLADNRVEHPFSQKISLRYGFAPVGYIPTHNGEPVALFARYFNDALKMRRNHPHVAPPVYWLAETALTNVGLPCDVIVDETARSYPAAEDFEIEEMNAAGYTSLLRFERGRLRKRDIFGPVKLHFGSRALQRHNTSYLIAKRGGHLMGAIGYSCDTNVDKAVRIFELIYLNEEPVRYLLCELERRCREEWKVDYVETDVSADAPRMQKTLLELGFLPIAYVPSAVFHYVERLDTVRMARYYIPVDATENSMVDAMKPIANAVLREFNRQWIDPVLAVSLPRTMAFKGLNDEQTAQLANLFTRQRFRKGDRIVQIASQNGKSYLLLSGQVEILLGSDKVADVLNPGEFFGEMALLSHHPHSACVRAIEEVEVAMIAQNELEELLRVRTDVGLIMYRNLAAGLGAKLRRLGMPAAPPDL
ncbi:GNAT family N-acetyltransferase [Rubinisphaera italica]|uniref:DNA-binding transcriptional dual regulator Crp n=1 Tax=Rubinisphaera italica TaxID=2527969 RepID=A0A5C5XC63_9PLAN|nr:GNAT family N-acetyltransferase [Rubinisphaera italica]TWT60727.1 DNA-binding transcriptional dual regulator Crp [Rubinisphaera italica]